MSLVSVIIPTFNRFETVKKAIQSVLNQTYQSFEIIVVNDCSTDPRYYNKELEAFPSTTVVHLPENLRKKYNCLSAQGKTRDEGIKIARGDWIALLDDDDYWYPDKLERQMRDIEKYTKILPHPILFCSSNMDVGHGIYEPSIQKRPYFLFPLPTIFTKEMIEKCNFINNSTAIFHQSLYEKVVEFTIGNYEDYDYWKRILNLPNVVCLYVDKPLIYYDQGHGDGKNYVLK